MIYFQNVNLWSSTKQKKTKQCQSQETTHSLVPHILSEMYPTRPRLPLFRLQPIVSNFQTTTCWYDDTLDLRYHLFIESGGSRLGISMTYPNSWTTQPEIGPPAILYIIAQLQSYPNIQILIFVIHWFALNIVQHQITLWGRSTKWMSDCPYEENRRSLCYY